ncbi:hypothetical protein O7602_26790 [Micromonospora sp. WMMD1128]|uniref:hypothetical protein n=1 Tax=Micromonospora sp. WMMD1128 TaxID=3015150 RepID=UPI00248B47F7|nr:hypothetical protein [Micromonospora sp. WMMD1128]WBB73250.1 hypothetical protein O7602_26790 [Micromonospora sp. WMMD1128]
MIRDPRTGREWGTAAQLAARLGPDITVAMIRNWANPKREANPLSRRYDRRGVYYPLDEAAAMESAKRKSKEETGKGRPRQLDATLAAAA